MIKLEAQELDNNIKQVKLIGRLDIQGTGDIELAFAKETAIKKEKIIVDLSELDFIASIGIRLILTNAKAQANRGGKIILFNPIPLVHEVLKTTGVNVLIPIYTDFLLASKYLNSLATKIKS